jgi:hypothetical protein
MSIGVLLAYERKKGRASHLWPYLALLPETPQCLWWQPSNEAAGVADIARRAGERSSAGCCHASMHMPQGPPWQRQVQDVRWHSWSGAVFRMHAGVASHDKASWFQRPPALRECAMASGCWLLPVMAGYCHCAGWDGARVAKAEWWCNDERAYNETLLQQFSELGIDAALGLTPAELKWGVATVRSAAGSETPDCMRMMHDALKGLHARDACLAGFSKGVQRLRSMACENGSSNAACSRMCAASPGGPCRRSSTCSTTPLRRARTCSQALLLRCANKLIILNKLSKPLFLGELISGRQRQCM